MVDFIDFFRLFDLLTWGDEGVFFERIGFYDRNDKTH